MLSQYYYSDTTNNKTIRMLRSLRYPYSNLHRVVSYTKIIIDSNMTYFTF